MSYLSGQQVRNEVRLVSVVFWGWYKGVNGVGIVQGDSDFILYALDFVW